jgi:hypothetical protein
MTGGDPLVGPGVASPAERERLTRERARRTSSDSPAASTGGRLNHRETDISMTLHSKKINSPRRRRAGRFFWLGGLGRE